VRDQMIARTLRGSSGNSIGSSTGGTGGVLRLGGTTTCRTK